MARVKSFTLDKKGYCIVEQANSYNLHSPDEIVVHTTLPQIKAILSRQIRSVEDAGMVSNVLSFFSSGRNNNLHNGTSGS